MANEVNRKNTESGVCTCGQPICPKTDPPQTLLPSQSRSIQYWACFFGVSDQTIANWFGDDVQKRVGRKLLTRAAVEAKFPDAITAGAA